VQSVCGRECGGRNHSYLLSLEQFHVHASFSITSSFLPIQKQEYGTIEYILAYWTYKEDSQELAINFAHFKVTFKLYL
jgi:hypothetical protein